MNPERPFIRPLLKALGSFLTGGRGGVVSADGHLDVARCVLQGGFRLRHVPDVRGRLNQTGIEPLVNIRRFSNTATLNSSFMT